MKLRQMAVSFLLKGEEVLFLQKKSKDTFLPGLLVPIGGHIEENEISDPDIACIREIEEETGLKSNNINELKLRYIVMRLKDNREIRVQYVYFGSVEQNAQLVESDEGELIWLTSKKILKSENVTATTKEIIKHYHENGQFNDNVYVGSMKSFNGEPDITWALLEDWELPIK
jgi:8-oxo-dGTP diphosphatase